MCGQYANQYSGQYYGSGSSDRTASGVIRRWIHRRSAGRYHGSRGPAPALRASLELIENGEYGWLVCRDFERLTAATEECLEMAPQAITQMGESVRQKGPAVP